MKKQADCNLRVPDRIFTETILKQELPDLLEALCRIPAPSGQEDGRIAKPFAAFPPLPARKTAESRLSETGCRNTVSPFSWIQPKIC